MSFTLNEFRSLNGTNTKVELETADNDHPAQIWICGYWYSTKTAEALAKAINMAVAYSEVYTSPQAMPKPTMSPKQATELLVDFADAMHKLYENPDDEDAKNDASNADKRLMAALTGREP